MDHVAAWAWPACCVKLVDQARKSQKIIVAGPRGLVKGQKVDLVSPGDLVKGQTGSWSAQEAVGGSQVRIEREFTCLEACRDLKDPAETKSGQVEKSCKW